MQPAAFVGAAVPLCGASLLHGPFPLSPASAARGISTRDERIFAAFQGPVLGLDARVLHQHKTFHADLLLTARWRAARNLRPADVLAALLSARACRSSAGAGVEPVECDRCGEVLDVAPCPRAGEGGEGVKVEEEELPPGLESYRAVVRPRCTSSRRHLRCSLLVLGVQLAPGVVVTSEPFAVYARPAGRQSRARRGAAGSSGDSHDDDGFEDSPPIEGHETMQWSAPTTTTSASSTSSSSSSSVLPLSLSPASEGEQLSVPSPSTDVRHLGVGLRVVVRVNSVRFQSEVGFNLMRSIQNEGSRETIERVGNCAFKALWFSVWAPVLWTLFRSETWFPFALGGSGFDPREMWRSWPATPAPRMASAAYCAELSYHLLSFSLHVLSASRRRRPDFAEMTLHHVCAVSLVALSYAHNFLRVGLVVMFIHASTDVFAYATKVVWETGHTRAVVVAYSFMTSTFLYCRLVVFPLWVLRSALVDSIEGLEPSERHGYAAFNAMLAALQALHVYWFVMIARLGIDHVRGANYRDVPHLVGTPLEHCKLP
eukprot:m51a1_g1163 hypothetical protein (543) ;mRNA; r:342248-352261